MRPAPAAGSAGAAAAGGGGGGGGGSPPAATPSSVFASARQALNGVEFLLQQLEAQDASAQPLSDDDSMRRHAITESLNRLTSEVAALHRIVADEYGGVAAASAKSDLWKKRCQQMQSEADAMRATVLRYLQTSYLVTKARQERDTRHRLFDNASGTQAVAVDSLLAERASASHSAQMIDEYTAMAGSVISSLKSQRATLKTAHKRALDIVTSLGLSSSIMRLVERRTTADKILVYGGMVFVVILVGIIYFWVMRR